MQRRRGVLKNNTDVKIFILFLLNALRYPITQDELTDILVADGFVGEYDVAACFSELCDMFPNAEYVHVGGDEAAIEKWTTNEACRAYAEACGIDKGVDTDALGREDIAVDQKAHRAVTVMHQAENGGRAGMGAKQLLHFLGRAEGEARAVAR